MKPTLLILAAGMGSRYGGLKQMDPFGPNGEAIIDYSIHDAIQAGYGKVVFVIKDEIDADFRKAVSDKWQGKIKVEHAYQRLDALPEGYSVPNDRTKPWGTGHALLVAEPFINEPFAVINADDFYGPKAYTRLAEFFQDVPDEQMYGMVGYHLDHTVSDHGTVNRGICKTDSENNLVSITEVTKIGKQGDGFHSEEKEFSNLELSGEEVTSMNFFGLRPSIFETAKAEFKKFLDERINEDKSEFFIPTLLNTMIERGEIKLKVIPTEEQWYGVTYREDREVVTSALKELISNEIYPEKLAV